jgi:N-acetylglucosamine-6-phosphate deacetylase
MSTTATALTGSRILAGRDWLSDHALVLDGGRIAAITPLTSVPSTMAHVSLEGGSLVAGFVDLQVNGGGGALLNDHPTVETIATMAAAHQRFGTTAMLPTLISADLAVVAQAIAAVDAAIAAGVPGIAGIHIEGPFLNRDKAGIHDHSKFRTIDADAIKLLSSLRNGRTLVTLAPETCPPGTISALVGRGVIVSAGHSLASYDQMQAAMAEGLSGVTHLYNAMSQMESRAPGTVGAALLDDRCVCGLIVDGRHVHPAAMRIAYAMKGYAGIALVTDAMSTLGSDQLNFSFNGQIIHADGGSCIAADGTLAGSNLDMATAVRNAIAMIGVDMRDALTMASATPATLIGLDAETGRIAPSLRADIVHLDDALEVRSTWIGGKRYGVAP